MREYKLTINNTPYVVSIKRVSEEEVVAEVNGQQHIVTINDINNLSNGELLQAETSGKPLPRPDTTLSPASSPAAVPANSDVKTVCSPIPGHILEIAVSVGDRVLAGQKLLVLEAMKMENIITAEVTGQIKAILVRTGDAVTHGQVMIEMS